MRKSTLLLAIGALVALPVVAKPAYVKKAKDLGIDAVKNCQSCHVEKMPSKAKLGEFNDLGKFLNKKKTDTKAAEVDVAWVKDFGKK